MTATYFSGKRLFALLSDRPRHSSKWPEGQIVGSGRIVANSEVTPFWSDFLVGGDSPGTWIFECELLTDCHMIPSKKRGGAGT
jgi:hypothetical protein